MVEKFDPDQPRDEQGQWTDGGGETAGPDSAGAQIPLATAAALNGADYIDNRKIGAVSEAILTGGDVNERGIDAGASDDHIGAARSLVESVRSADEKEVALYRGISSDKPIESIESLKPGDSIEMARLTSFSEGRDYAALYSEKSGGMLKYEIQLHGTAKTVPTDQLTGQKHREHITHGKFEVVSVQQGERIGWFGNHTRYKLQITVRQVGVL
jgi:hypothetical protein